MKILHKIATVLVTLLLYFVIVLLQTPKAARADHGLTQPHARPSAHAIVNGRAALQAFVTIRKPDIRSWPSPQK